MQVPTKNLEIQPYRGGLVLVGSSLDNTVDVLYPNTKRSSSHSLHITLLSAAEYKAAGKPNIPDIPLDHIYALTRLQRSGVSWIVVVWNHADIWRTSIGLNHKDYHVTLSEEDDHDLDKSLAGLRQEEEVRRLAGVLEEMGKDAMDHTWVKAPRYMYGLTDIQQEILSERIILSWPDSFKGYVRLGETSHHTNPKLSCLSYARAYTLNPLPLLIKRLVSLRHQSSFGPITTAAELTNINPDIIPYLGHPWPDLPSYLTLYPTQSRDRAIYQSYELPRNFSYIYPNIAGMSTPRNTSDIDTLIKLGFTHILTLTAETPLDPDWFQFKAITHVYIPVPNWEPPTLAEMDLIWEMIQEGGKWVVHCGGGVGRAGTALACLIAMLGEGDQPESTYPILDAKTAISLLRQARPRSLESDQQENLVSRWVSHRWKISSTSNIVEPVSILSHTPIPTGPICLFLIGRPGSGKSWLSEVLSKRRKCVVVSQDESSSRLACERQLSVSLPDDTLLILDRCNPRIDDRKVWLDLIDRRAVAVYFDYPKDLCEYRINRRLDHPTLRPGRGNNALSQMDREMQSPTMEEGFAAIVTISSFSAARKAIDLFSAPPGIVKFPRTPHLLNLGAKTDDDLVLPPFTTLKGNLVIEEKIDGANMGISLDFDGEIRVQNRSHWVSANDHAQFKPLTKWIQENKMSLRRILHQDPTFPERWILYGEWVVAKHSIHYARLPDRFLAFDLYDRLNQTFVSRSTLSTALEDTGIHQVPLIARLDTLDERQIHAYLATFSAFGKSRIEGIYVKMEDATGQRTVDRSKVVRGDFIAGNEHWGKQALVLNGYIE